jgi:hypothetical protein
MREIIAMTDCRVGFWSAVALAAIGAGYLLVLVVGIVRHGSSEPIADPVLATMEILTLLAAVPLVTLMAAIQSLSPPHQRACAAAALAFATLCAGVTSVVHFVALTAARQLGAGGISWPSRSYAAELLAWDVFLGLALLFAAPVLRDRDHARPAYRALQIGGSLCLFGAVGPAVGSMELQRLGVFGYAVVWPVACILLARVFARWRASPGETPASG